MKFNDGAEIIGEETFDSDCAIRIKASVKFKDSTAMVSKDQTLNLYDIGVSLSKSIKDLSAFSLSLIVCSADSR